MYCSVAAQISKTKSVTIDGTLLPVSENPALWASVLFEPDDILEIRGVPPKQVKQAMAPRRFRWRAFCRGYRLEPWVDACRLAGVEPTFTEWDGQGSPLHWVISENLIRRHLSSSQRAVIAHDLLPLLEKEAKDRQRLSLGRGKKGRKSLDNLLETGRSAKIAARIAKTNSAYVQAVKSINRSALELVEKVRAGDLSIPDAQKLADLPKLERKRLLKLVNGNGHNGDLWRQVFQAETVGQDGKTRPRPFFGGCNQPVTKQNDVRTPDGLCQFLHDLISPHYPARVILDPCAGDGALTRPWKGVKVHWFEIKRGKDFFQRRNPFPDVELTMANPPFSGNPDGKELFPARFLSHLFEIVPSGCPIVFFAPFHFLLNSRIKSNDYAGRENRYAWLRDGCPPITSILSLPQDAFVVNSTKPLVHSMVLLFNMPRLPPCIFVPQEYLGW